MKTNNIVYFKDFPDLLGEVINACEENVELKLCGSSTVIKVKPEDIKIHNNVNQPHFEDTSVNILGSIYSIIFRTLENEPRLENADGITDFTTKEIFIRVCHQEENTVADLTEYTKKVIRHEIIHAFLGESGLRSNSGYSNHWALNEEMVDYFAIQFHKIEAAFKEVGV